MERKPTLSTGKLFSKLFHRLKHSLHDGLCQNKWGARRIREKLYAKFFTFNKISILLNVKNNEKGRAGRSRAREDIERRGLSRFAMEKTDKRGWEYLLTIPYTTDEGLDQIIFEENYGEAESIADLRHGFTEGDVTSLDDLDKSW